MRAFIAIDLPKELHAALSREQSVLRRAAPDARWTRPEGIHLTLKFLGEITDRQCARVREALGLLGPLEKFSVEVKGFGFFPDARRPRVFWAGVEAPPALEKLAQEIEKAAARLGFTPENRPFKPHLTLARFKEPRPQPALLAAIAERTGGAPEAFSLGRFEASEFFLYESKLSPEGAEYLKLAQFPSARASSSLWK
jgi:2'-5' RNA ligase